MEDKLKRVAIPIEIIQEVNERKRVIHSLDKEFDQAVKSRKGRDLSSIYKAKSEQMFRLAVIAQVYIK